MGLGQRHCGGRHRLESYTDSTTAEFVILSNAKDLLSFDHPESPGGPFIAQPLAR